MLIITTKTFDRAIAKLSTPETCEAMESAIASNPRSAPVIRGTGGIRKLRWSGSGRGKRGGLRIIYYYQPDPETIYLLAAYAKSSQGDLSAADRKAWAKVVAAIKKEEHA